MHRNGIFNIKLREKLGGNIVFVHINCWLVCSNFKKLLGTLQNICDIRHISKRNVLSFVPVFSFVSRALSKTNGLKRLVYD